MKSKIILTYMAAIVFVSAAPAAGPDGGVLDLDWRAFQIDAEDLRRRVMSDPHFAGFAIMNVKQPYAIVSFTGDAEARLRQYTSNPRYRPLTAGVSLAELEALKGHVAGALHALGLSCEMVDADEQLGQVMVSVVEMEKVEQAIAEGRLKVPPRVKFRRIAGCPRLY